MSTTNLPLSITRFSLIVLFCGHVSSCYALALAAPTEEESLNQFDMTMARRQSYEQNAELARRAAERPAIEQKAALQSLRSGTIVVAPSTEPEESETELVESNTWLAISLVAGIPIAAFLAILWLTRRAMQSRSMDQANMLRRIRPALAAAIEAKPESKRPAGKSGEIPLKYLLAAEWKERQRQAAMAAQTESNSLPTTVFEFPPKPAVPLILPRQQSMSY